MSIVLFAYVDGSDLADVESQIEPLLEQLVASRRWQVAPFVVNQVSGVGSAGDLPDWELGLNLQLPEQRSEILGLELDLAALISGLEAVAKGSARDFVLGVGLPSGVSEDLDYVPGASSNSLLSKLVAYLHQSGHLAI